MRITVALDGPELDIPEHPDGDVWVHVVEHGGPEGDEVTFADSAAEALSILIPDYEEIPDEAVEDAEEARYLHAARLGSTLQAFLVERALSEGDFDMANASEAVLTALMTDKTKTLPPDILDGGWGGPVPLILIDLNYAPFGEQPLPEGDVTVLRVHDEVDYLTSLHEIGMIRYYIQATGDTEGN